MKNYILILTLISVFSCKKTATKQTPKDTKKQEAVVSQKFSEEELALNKEYKIGDVRRYGIFPDSAYAYTHPITKKPKITTVLDLAENEDITLFFPKGYYQHPLKLIGKKNIKLNFNDAIFDLIYLLPNDKTKTEDISLKGKVTLYDKLYISDAKNIKLDSIIIKPSPNSNSNKMRPRGCQIFYGSKNIEISYLQIDDIGSGNDFYKHVGAGLAIDGWGNQPKNVFIDKVYIKSTDRHGVYLTGENHFIGEIIIDKFGAGDAKDMAPMQDAGENEHPLFAGVWINRCYDSKINSIVINNKNSKGFFTTNFDEGDKNRPVEINYLEVKNFNRTLPVGFTNDTGVIVKEIKK